jgi:hypothetical protein
MQSGRATRMGDLIGTGLTVGSDGSPSLGRSATYIDQRKPIITDCDW